MTTGTSIFLIAVGAILRYAVNASVSGFNIHSAGLILMIVGIIGLVLSLLWLASTSRRGRVAQEPAVVERPVVREREYL